VSKLQSADLASVGALPGWLPEDARLYLEHTEAGLSLRALARREGCHASTVLRKVRRYESRRDDPLIDEGLSRLGRFHMGADKTPAADCQKADCQKKEETMSAQIRLEPQICDEATIRGEAPRILRRLCEADVVLAIAPDMEKAVVLRRQPNGELSRIAVVDRGVAQAFALKDWIVCDEPGRVAQYRITSAGRAAVRRMLGGMEGLQAADGAPAGFAEAQSPFADQHRDYEYRDIPDGGRAHRLRVNMAESPVAALARRRDKNGKPFLTPDLVAAAERLREDFELAQMGARVAQNWDRFLTGGGRGAFDGGSPGQGPRAARDRVAAALRDLGPGLGDMTLRCCCYLEGLEAAERRLGWSARSGKIVLRIALLRLRRHYDEVQGAAPLIG
jgi:hypothetical protein